MQGEAVSRAQGPSSLTGSIMLPGTPRLCPLPLTVLSLDIPSPPKILPSRPVPVLSPAGSLFCPWEPIVSVLVNVTPAVKILRFFPTGRSAELPKLQNSPPISAFTTEPPAPPRGLRDLPQRPVTPGRLALD